MPHISHYKYACIIHGSTRVWGRPDGAEIPTWDDLSDHARDLAALAVEKLLGEPPHTPEELHEIWAQPLRDLGWVCGPGWCDQKKHHPCLVPYDELPESEKIKDHLWSAMIEVFRKIEEGKL